MTRYPSHSYASTVDQPLRPTVSAPVIDTLIEPVLTPPNPPALLKDPAKPWQFQPGNNANPAGRPKKGATLTDALKAKLSKPKLAAALLKLAYAGDVAALKYVYDRVDGTPVQRVEDVTPDRIRAEAIRVAELLGTTPDAVLLEYDRLRLPPG